MGRGKHYSSLLLFDHHWISLTLNKFQWRAEHEISILVRIDIAYLNKQKSWRKRKKIVKENDEINRNLLFESQRQVPSIKSCQWSINWNVHMKEKLQIREPNVFSLNFNVFTLILPGFSAFTMDQQRARINKSSFFFKIISHFSLIFIVIDREFSADKEKNNNNVICST